MSVLAVPKEPCVGCGISLPVSATTQVDTGAGIVTMCGRCRHWQGGRACHPEPGWERLPADVQETMDAIRHRPDCPKSPSFDARRTRTNLTSCPLAIVGKPEGSGG